MSHSAKGFFFLLSLWIWAVPLQAVAETAEQAFDKGVAAAADGDYEKALQWFTQAREKGLKRPSLDYNLGVAYYRLGRLDAARRHFERLSAVPGYAAIAHYNLGLVANKAGDEAAAIVWFRRAREEARDPRLKRLSALALRRLGVVEARRPPARRGSGFAAVQLGYDSNVKLASDVLPQATGQDDGYAEVMAGGGYWLTGGSQAGLRLNMSADLQRYQDLTDYDYGQLQLGLYTYRRLARWRLRAGLSWNESFLGGNRYLRILGAELRARHALSKADQLRLRYRFNRLRANDDRFDSLAGLRHQVRAGLRHRAGGHRLTGYYQLELNDRNDSRTLAGFTSTSPTRHALGLSVDLRLAAVWRGRLDGRYRLSRYNDPSDTSNGPITREDRQWRLAGRLSYQVAEDWEIEGQYSYYANNSNMDGDTYHRHLVSLGVSRYF